MKSHKSANDVRESLLDALLIFSKEDEQNRETPPLANEIHEMNESNSHPPQTVNKLCMHYTWNGTCNTPNCRFLHSNQLKTSSPSPSAYHHRDVHSSRDNFRVQECDYFKRHGVCGFGDRCKYLHTQDPEASKSHHLEQHGQSFYRGAYRPSSSNRGGRGNYRPPSYRNSRAPFHPPRPSSGLSMHEGHFHRSSPDTGSYPGYSISHGRSNPESLRQEGLYKRASPGYPSRDLGGSDSGFEQSRNSPYSSTPSQVSSLTPPHTSPNTVSVGDVQSILENTSQQVFRLVHDPTLSNMEILFVHEKQVGQGKENYHGLPNTEIYRLHVMAVLRVFDQDVHTAASFFKDARHLAILQQLMRATFSTSAGHPPRPPQDIPLHSFQRCFLPLIFLAIHPTLCLPRMLDTAELLHALFLVSLPHLFDQFHGCTQECLERGLLEERQCSSRTLLLYDPGIFIPFSFLQVFGPFIQLLDILVTKYPELMPRLFDDKMNSLESLLNTWQQKVNHKALPTMESKSGVATVKDQFETFKLKLTGRPPYPYLMNRRKLM